MVKGISRQVIVVHSPEQKLFEQAIFILKDGQQGVTDEALMKEAQRLIRNPGKGKEAGTFASGPLWACGGALITAAAWLLSTML